MRRAIGRLLGVLFTLALVSVVALTVFSTLAHALKRPGLESRNLPFFFNPSPANVHDLAERAMAQITEGSAPAAGARDLVRLGGAALPHVLPRLDQLSPRARGKVATALAPVAERIGLARAGDLSDPERAMLFWARFWQDREFDFRPQVVRRLVQRLSERPSGPTHDDLVKLDTYAAPTLVRALGRVRTEQDLGRVRRLTQVLARATGRGPVVEDNADPSEANQAIREWRRFFAEEGADYQTLDGPRRIVAIFAQTQYGRWIGRLLGALRDAAGIAPALGLSARQMLTSGFGYSVALLGAAGIAILWAKFELGQRSPVRRAMRALAALGVALPAPLLVPAALPGSSGWSKIFVAVLVTALLAGSALSRLQVSALLDARFGPPIRTRAIVGETLGFLPALLGWAATSWFGLELLLRIDGAASATLQDLEAGEVTAGMTLALGGALVAATVSALADKVMGWRVRIERPPVLLEVGGAGRTRRIRIALAGLVLLAILGLGWSEGNAVATPGWDDLAGGARTMVSLGVITTAVAGLSGMLFGLLSTTGPRAFDASLVRCAEVSGALPALLWVVALSHAVGIGLVFAFGLGLLRGIDVAWVLRTELMRRSTLNRELFVGSRGVTSWLSAYYRQRLRPAALPTLCTVFMTPAWWIGTGSAAWLLGTDASTGQREWGSLLGIETAPFLPKVLAAALIAFVTWVLLGFVTAAPRRLGSLRSSFPPPP